ncbi:MAG: alpha/beta hydrolase [Lachnospiraceae bacterium]|nr:alpha/beta hydrolase [Lachnospiraceae bacterium]
MVTDMGYQSINDKITLFYEEFGSGDNIILSAQVGFYKKGMQQKLAEMGYHVYCITLRGFHPSTLVEEDYGENWYDVFADDLIAFADKMNIDRFYYMGASHGAGVGWHLMLRNPQRVKAFIAVVAGPHSLKEGTMSYRQMLEQGIIKCPPPFDPEIDNDSARELRRRIRSEHISKQPEAPALEKKVDYGRPLMRLKTEERLCEELRKIETPTLLIGGINDPISTPELMMRTASCLPHCKLVIYSNCGHNIDTDLIEETCEETDRFIKNYQENGKWYKSVVE